MLRLISLVCTDAAYANADGHAVGQGAIVYTDSAAKSSEDFGSGSVAASIAVNDLGKRHRMSLGCFRHASDTRYV